MAALHELDVKSADVLNAYMMAPYRENIWTVLGWEVGDDAGKPAIIVRALYGLMSAGVFFWAHLAQCMKILGYESCKANPDLWQKPQNRPQDEFKYNSYILFYVDDILCINHDPDDVLNE